MSYEIFKNLNIEIVPETENDFDEFFTKFAMEHNPKNFSDLQTMIKEAYDSKYDIDLTKWETKLSLDKNKIQEIWKLKN